ncbi:MAG: prepilin-type N-terminal cleavage/methylation domain-containing protein [Deltaproteobacteria bacterium]|nr:prepilin-type N-terminal cleavage/methylation domain-containing protein [Deltaproteobacteria bacterium]
MNSRKGFTLVEVIVVLAVIAILAAIAVPLALRIFERTAEDATREELANLKEAMIGDPQKLQSSFRSDFGFLGDMGRLPANLDELLVRGSLPAFTFDTSKQAGAGWKGPYITGAAAGSAAAEFKKDQWGNDYTYSDADFTNADNQAGDGKITSNGPNGTFGNADDIVLEFLKNETTATVRGKVKDTAGVGLEAVPVEYYSPVNGVLTTTTATTDATGEYVFTSAPFGPRAVRALPRLVYSPGSVTTAGVGRNITFKVVNYSTSAYTVDRVQANYSGGATYDEVRINGVAVDPLGTFSSGTNVDVTNTVIAASSASRPSMRVFVDSPDTQLPDTTISGQGTVAAIELNNFTQDMRGIPITVTFNPTGGFPISIVKFTP